MNKELEKKFPNSTYLQEIFYISSKHNSLYRVSLTDYGLNLCQELPSGKSKTKSITFDDIIGCQCLRAMQDVKKGPSCVCHRRVRTPNRPIESTKSINFSADSSAYVFIYACILKKKAKQRQKMNITLRFRSFDNYDDNLREAMKWKLAIKCLCAKLPIPRNYMSPSHRDLLTLISAFPEEASKFLIILNPKSGPGKSKEIFQRRIHPILAEAEKPYDVFITKYSNYARNLLRTHDLNQCSGLVVVGGDGMVFEVINGILQRKDWSHIINVLPIGIIPCGSGNGLAKSIAFSKNEPFDHDPLLISTMSLLRGKKTKMDLVKIETENQTLYSFLSVGWGFLADVDIESERLRILGGQRFIIWSMARLLGLRTYRGIVSYLPCDPRILPSPYTSRSPTVSTNEYYMTENVEYIKFPIRSKKNSCENYSRRYNDKIHQSKSCQNDWNTDKDLLDALKIKDGTGKIATSEIPDNLILLEAKELSSNKPDSFYDTLSFNSYFTASSSSAFSIYHSFENISTTKQIEDFKNITHNNHGPASSIPPLTAEIPNNWIKVNGEFVMVHAAYQTHISQDCYFAPKAKLADGIIWLLIIKAGISKSNLLQFLLGLSTGTHLNCSGVEVVPVTAFRIEPADNTFGVLTIDGEKIKYGPLQAEVLPSLATVMCP